MKSFIKKWISVSYMTRFFMISLRAMIENSSNEQNAL